MLYLIRHAQSQMNLAKTLHPGRLHSQTGVLWDISLVDPDISVNGVSEIAMARSAAQLLPITKIYVSPMRRALQTCQGLFSGHPNSPKIVVLPHATEIVSDAGDISKGNFTDRESYPDYDWSIMEQQDSTYWMISVSDSEVFPSVVARCANTDEIVAGLCKELERRHPDYLERKKESKRRVATMRDIVLSDVRNGECVAVVGHADILRLLMKTVLPPGEEFYLKNSAPVRFPHWKSHIRKGAKLTRNPQINLKERTPPKKLHDFIDFRTLTGNEILYNLQNAQHFRPFEYSNSFLNLGLKKGAPANYSWESNPFVQTALQYGKTKIPQFNCKVLTSLAHAWNRLGIKDPEAWKLLETNILRQFTTIEPAGLAKSMQAFINIPSEQFWEKVEEMLPVYLRQFNAADFTRAVEAFATRTSNPHLEMYEKYIYPHLKLKRFSCTPSMLERLLKALESREDFTQERRDMVTEAIVQRYQNLKRVKFGGLNVSYEAKDKSQPVVTEIKPESKATTEETPSDAEPKKE